MLRANSLARYLQIGRKLIECDRPITERDQKEYGCPINELRLARRAAAIYDAKRGKELEAAGLNWSHVRLLVKIRTDGRRREQLENKIIAERLRWWELDALIKKRDVRHGGGRLTGKEPRLSKTRDRLIVDVDLANSLVRQLDAVLSALLAGNSQWTGKSNTVVLGPELIGLRERIDVAIKHFKCQRRPEVESTTPSKRAV